MNLIYTRSFATKGNDLPETKTTLTLGNLFIFQTHFSEEIKRKPIEEWTLEETQIFLKHFFDYREMEIPEDFKNLTGQDLANLKEDNIVDALPEENKLIGPTLFNTIQELKKKQSKILFVPFIYSIGSLKRLIDRLKNRKIKRNLEPTFKFQFKERSEAIEDLGDHIKKLFKSFSGMSSTRSDHGFPMLPTGSGMGKSFWKRCFAGL